jgi:outer membrane protein assembly factor BamB
MIVIAFIPLTLVSCSTKTGVHGRDAAADTNSVPWSQLHGNASKNALGVGSGCKGVKAWSLKAVDGDHHFGDIAVGENNTLYCWAGPELAAIDGSTGSKKWGVICDPRFGIGGCPAVSPDGNIVYARQGGNLYAVASTTGAKLWEKINIKAGSPPAVGDDGSVVVRTQGGLIALDGRSGAQKWSCMSAPSGFICSPTIGPDGTVYVINDMETVCAFDGRTGSKKWERKDRSSYYVSSTPVLGLYGLLYLRLGSGDLAALDSKTGEKRWIASLGKCESEPGVGPDGTVYAGASDGLRALDGKTGAQKWTSAGLYDTTIMPVVVAADGTVFAVQMFDLSAFDGKTGARRTDFIPPTHTVLGAQGMSVTATDSFSNSVSPTIGSDGTIYMLTMGGNDIYALR